MLHEYGSEDMQSMNTAMENIDVMSELEDNNYNAYTLDVTLTHAIIPVKKQYSEFYELNEQLKVLFPCIRLVFPPMICKEKVTEDILIERQCALEQFLENIVCHRRMFISEPVKDFLDINEKVVNVAVRDQAFDEILYLQDADNFVDGQGSGELHDIPLSVGNNVGAHNRSTASKTIITELQKDLETIIEDLKDIGALDNHVEGSDDHLTQLQRTTTSMKGEIRKLQELNRTDNMHQEVEDDVASVTYNTVDWNTFFDKQYKTEESHNPVSLISDDDDDSTIGGGSVEDGSDSGDDHDADYASSSCFPSLPLPTGSVDDSKHSGSDTVNTLAVQWMKRGKELLKSTIEIAKPASDTTTIVTYRRDAGQEVKFQENSSKNKTSENKMRNWFMKDNTRGSVQHRMRRVNSCESLQWEEEMWTKEIS